MIAALRECDNCGQRRADVAERLDDSFNCDPCWRAALAHGHAHGLHTDDTSADTYNAVPDCPLCTRKVTR